MSLVYRFKLLMHIWFLFLFVAMITAVIYAAVKTEAKRDQNKADTTVTCALVPEFKCDKPVDFSQGKWEYSAFDSDNKSVSFYRNNE